jgi:5'-nucleotidase
MTQKKKIIYIDLDGVVADYDKDTRRDENGHVCEGFYENLELVEGSVEALTELSKYYELYFLSTPSWSNPRCWMEKRIWVEKHFGDLMEKRLILAHNKGLLKGDYLIDDRIVNGVDEFEGEHIHFGTGFPNWKSILKYLALCRLKEAKDFAEYQRGYKRYMETR